jgi:hypothetical protein
MAQKIKTCIFKNFSFLLHIMGLQQWFNIVKRGLSPNLKKYSINIFYLCILNIEVQK